MKVSKGWAVGRENKEARSTCCRLLARTVPDEAAVRLGGEGFNSLLGKQAVTSWPLAEQADKAHRGDSPAAKVTYGIP